MKLMKVNKKKAQFYGRGPNFKNISVENSKILASKII